MQINLDKGIVKTFSFSILFFGISSCATEYSFQTSTITPAAEASVKVKEDHNSNYESSLSIIRLADPQRLTPARHYYVTWMVPESNGTLNIGQLETSSGLFSKPLKSYLQTVTPFKPVSFFISAEDDPHVQFPGEQIVLRTI